MNDGVKILLERMKTHPEEFYGSYNRWTETIERFEKFFNASEKALINGALTNIRRDEFTQIVMNEILREPTPVEIDPDTFTIKTAGRYAFNSPTTTANTIRLGQETLDEDTLTHMKEHLKQLKLAGKI